MADLYCRWHVVFGQRPFLLFADNVSEDAVDKADQPARLLDDLEGGNGLIYCCARVDAVHEQELEKADTKSGKRPVFHLV